MRTDETPAAENPVSWPCGGAGRLPSGLDSLDHGSPPGRGLAAARSNPIGELHDGLTPGGASDEFGGVIVIGHDHEQVLAEGYGLQGSGDDTPPRPPSASRP